jgi:hypothetical protein
MHVHAHACIQEIKVALAEQQAYLAARTQESRRGQQETFMKRIMDKLEQLDCVDRDQHLAQLRIEL